MKTILSLFLFSSVFLVSCSQIRNSAGVNRKHIDEFKVVENPPLVIPPDFNLLPPDQLSEKDIDNVEGELAKEILFGLNQENENENVELSMVNTIYKNPRIIKYQDSISRPDNILPILPVSFPVSIQ